MTRKEYESQLAKIKHDNVQKKYKKSLKDAKWREPKQHIETSKKLAVYLFIILNVIVVYCLIAMWYFADLTYLGTLISDIAAQILIYGIYCLKAFKAKQSEENVKLEREKMQGVGDLIEAGADANEYVPVKGDVTKFEAPASRTI